jgi:adenine-specific DNA-methyltransferase
MQKITANSPESKSPDLVADNIAKLKELFPELFTEGKEGTSVNVDVLKQLVGDMTVTDVEEKYGLNWHGKRKSRQLALTPSTGTLRPCPEESVDWLTTRNLMIEGDNLEVLKLLQKSYSGKVKMIYIDPPYNTGKDFIYPDNFQDNIRNYLELTGQIGESGGKTTSNTEASGRFHTEWLNMMYPRLRLARSLLREDGVIFISIDDSEVANARMICDEIFGEENFMTQIVWKSRYNAAKEIHLAQIHEYILLYARNIDMIGPIYLPVTEDYVSRYFKLEDENSKTRGPYRLQPLEAGKSMDARENLRYAVPAPDGTQVLPLRQWKWGEARTMEALKNGELEFRRTATGWSISTKQYLKDEAGDEYGIKGFSIIDGIYNQAGSKEQQKLFNSVTLFPFPKPTALIDYLQNIASVQSGDIVMDFFAGFGTTGHSVMNRALESTSGVRFILVQLPEPTPAGSEAAKEGYRTIAELTKERLRRARAMIVKDKPLLAGDLGFRVFKLSSTNFREWVPKRVDIADSLDESIDHLKNDRNEQDILFELLLKLGFDLCVPVEERRIAGKTVYSIGVGTLIVCLAENLSRDEVELLAFGIVQWHSELAPAGDAQCVFRDSSFADDVAKVNLAAILEQHGIKSIRSI